MMTPSHPTAAWPSFLRVLDLAIVLIFFAFTIGTRICSIGNSYDGFAFQYFIDYMSLMSPLSVGTQAH